MNGENSCLIYSKRRVCLNESKNARMNKREREKEKQERESEKRERKRERELKV